MKMNSTYVSLILLSAILAATLYKAVASQLDVPRSVLQYGSAEDVPEYEFQALYNLYDATNGEHWSWGQEPGIPWNFTDNTNPCVDNWEGIACTFSSTDGYKHIEMISLQFYNLVGYLPASLGNLSYLRNLTMGDNFLTHSTLPDSLGSLTALQVFSMEFSMIAGTLPQSFRNLSNLQVLELSDNALTGPFPAVACYLSQLTSLHLEGNLISGSIPACMGQLTQLQVLDCNYNRLNGTLPASIGSLTQLLALSVGINEITGTIPDSFAALTRLKIIGVSSNRMNGTIPEYLGTFSDLLEIDFDTNYFTGTIPASLGNLLQMQILYFFSNNLHGTIPQSLAKLTQLDTIDLDSNWLTGTIPPFLGTFMGLVYLSLYNNDFSGTLPDTLGNLLKLKEVDFGSNHLTGTIPPAIGELKLLYEFIAPENMFSGPVPPGLFQLPQMTSIDLSSNRLTGPLPAPPPLYAASKLFFLSMSINHLSGTIPQAMGNFQELLYINLSKNALSDNLPESVCSMSSLNYLYLGNNRLSGELPGCWRDLNATLGYFFINNNHLTGHIPPSLGALVRLQSLNLSSNYFSGQIPSSFAGLRVLQVLLLQSNQLTGPIAHIVNATIQRNITVIELSDNQLSGSLPDVIFALERLQVFAAISNCFTGSIPQAVCSSETLVTLALDGLQSATSCQNKLFPSSFDNVVAPNLYAIGSPLSGGVPTCLFQMANLTTLHLSGNGLTGTLPDDITVSATLTDLSLSHNKLHGTVPKRLLSRHWTNLDLSYNKFTDSLRIDGNAFAIEASLSLQQNRLSGVVPGALQNVETISVLESNHFACDSQRSDLPDSDPDREKYQCGSDTWNATIYAWLAIVAVAAVIVAAIRWQKHSWEAEVALVRKWWEASELSGAFAVHSSTLLHYADMCAAVKLVEKFTLRCFAYTAVVLLPVYIGVSQYYGTYDHAYAWDFSAAYLSGALSFGLMFVFLVLLIAFASATSLKLLNNGAEGPKETALSTTDAAGSRWNRVLVYGSYIALNFMIVLGVNIAYVVIALNQNGEALTLAQISLALFKVAFNGVCSPLLIRWTSHRVLKSSEEASTADLISIQLFVTLVNNILIPCLVVAIISPDCFYNIFNAASEVTSSFSYPVTSYSPPFAYSYQCSSSFITYYAPAYVIMCIIASFGIPVAQVLLQRLHSRAVKGTRWFALLDLLLPRILKSPDIASPPAARNVFAPYFDATQHMITLLTYVGLLLTFGAVFPPLALCFAVTIASIAAFTKLKVGRFLSQAVELDTPQYLTVVNQECEGVGSAAILARSIYMMVVFSCLFYTLFLFDTLGDAVGVSKAYWVLIVVPLLPLVSYACFVCYMNVVVKPHNGSADADSLGRETELVNVEVRSPLA